MQKQLKNLAKFISLFSLLAFFPMMAFAAGTTSCSSATGLSAVICTIQSLFAAILPVLVAFGVLYFVWGMIMYFVVDSEEAKKTGRDRIINGVIGLAVILGIWGIVNILMVTFNLSGGALAAPQGININGAPNACTACSTAPTLGSTFQAIYRLHRLYSQWLDHSVNVRFGGRVFCLGRDQIFHHQRG